MMLGEVVRRDNEARRAKRQSLIDAQELPGVICRAAARRCHAPSRPRRPTMREHAIGAQRPAAPPPRRRRLETRADRCGVVRMRAMLPAPRRRPRRRRRAAAAAHPPPTPRAARRAGAPAERRRHRANAAPPKCTARREPVDAARSRAGARRAALAASVGHRQGAASSAPPSPFTISTSRRGAASQAGRVARSQALPQCRLVDSEAASQLLPSGRRPTPRRLAAPHRDHGARRSAFVRRGDAVTESGGPCGTARSGAHTRAPPRRSSAARARAASRGEPAPGEPGREAADARSMAGTHRLATPWPPLDAASALARRVALLIARRAPERCRRRRRRCQQPPPSTPDKAPRHRRRSRRRCRSSPRRRSLAERSPPRAAQWR